MFLREVFSSMCRQAGADLNLPAIPRASSENACEGVQSPLMKLEQRELAS